MKTLTKLMSLLLICSTLLCYSCSSGDSYSNEVTDTNDDAEYEIVGVWKAEFNIKGEIGTCDLQINKNKTAAYYWKSNKQTETRTLRWSYHVSYWTFDDFTPLAIVYDKMTLVGNKLVASSYASSYDDIVFYREGESSGSDKYSGKDFVGTWQGSDGSDEFVIQLDADGSFTDWLVINGNKTNKTTGQYTVEGTTLTAPNSSNLTNAWGNKPYTISFSGSNKMTLTNSLMNDYNQKLVLNRK